MAEFPSEVIKFWVAVLLNTDSVSLLKCISLLQSLPTKVDLLLTSPLCFLHLACYKNTFYPFGSPFTSQLHGESVSQGSYICLPKGLPKFKVSNTDLCELGEMRKRQERVTFSLELFQKRFSMVSVQTLVELTWGAVYEFPFGALCEKVASAPTCFAASSSSTDFASLLLHPQCPWFHLQN